MMTDFLLLLLGLFVGFTGTLIGAGGGFILMPFFFFLYPERAPEELTAVSLAVVFFNALSGSLIYARRKRIHYPSAALFILSTAPGAIVGAFVTSHLSRKLFDPIFACALMGAGLYLSLRALPHSAHTGETGQKARLDYNKVKGGLVSFGTGFLSSLLGIGGGIIHVPMLIHMLGFPVHIATATSHMVLAATSLVSVTVYYFQGAFANVSSELAWLVPGVLIGAQLGARASSRIQGKWILRALALALVLVGLRLLLS
jgi:uncharacterized membrane protein YfcA